jgi:hypothetical protein
MRRLGVKRIAGLGAIYPCQILQPLSCFLTTTVHLWFRIGISQWCYTSPAQSALKKLSLRSTIFCNSPTWEPTSLSTGRCESPSARKTIACPDPFMVPRFDIELLLHTPFWAGCYERSSLIDWFLWIILIAPLVGGLPLCSTLMHSLSEWATRK